MNGSESLLNALNTITWVSCVIIVAFAIGFAVYIVRLKNQNELSRRRQWVEQMPTIVSTLGVLGTFIGITIGLFYFDTGDLDKSIPLLLSGLKTAFVTSLAGMIGGLILTRLVNKCFDEVDSEEHNMDKTIRLITALTNLKEYLSGEEMKKYRSGITDSFTRVSETLDRTRQSIDGLSSAMNDIRDDIEEIKGLCNDISGGMSAGSDTAGAVGRLTAVAVTATESISRMENSIASMESVTGAIADSVGELGDELDQIRSNTSREK